MLLDLEAAPVHDCRVNEPAGPTRPQAPGEKIYFEGQLTPRDYTDAMKLHFWPARPVLVFSLVGIALAFVLFIFLVLPWLQGDEWWWLSSGFPVVMFIVFWVIIIWWSLRFGTRRQLESNPFSSGVLRGWISAWGLELGGAEWSSRFPWAMLFRTKSSDELVLLYHGMNVFNVFPRRFFTSQADWEAFSSWATQRESTPISIRDRRTGRRNLFLLFLVVLAVILLIVAINVYWLINVH